MATKKKMLLKIVVLGESAVGKTALLNQFVNGEFIEHHKSTIGADLFTKEIEHNDISITLQIWDTAGQERFQSLGNSFYRGADGCILVYDITKKNTLKKISHWKSQFESINGQSNEFPFLLLGNKYDLSSTKRQIDEQTAKQYADSNGMLWYETSAVNGHNIETAIREISDRASEMDSAPIFNTQAIKHEDLEEYEQNEQDQETGDGAKTGCCELL
eukprot:163700_1